MTREAMNAMDVWPLAALLLSPERCPRCGGTTEHFLTQGGLIAECQRVRCAATWETQRMGVISILVRLP